MKKPNPLVPQGSFLDQRLAHKHSVVRMTVFTVLALHLSLLAGMLIQGCKQQTPETSSSYPPSNAAAQNAVPAVETSILTNPITIGASNSLPINTTGESNGPAKQPELGGVPGRVLSPDDTGAIPLAARMEVSNAAPVSTVELPRSSSPPAVPAVTSQPALYVVKKGDTLTKIALSHGTTIKALRAANQLATDRILVGQKLKLP